MKTHLSLFLLLAGMSVLVSCNEPFQGTPKPVMDKEAWNAYDRLLTKSIDSRLATDGVSEEDVKNYLLYSMQVPATEVTDISRYDIDDDVYIYIVNLRDGRWYFFSGDYSSGPIVGGGETGGFYPNRDLSAHIEKWLASIRDHILANRLEESQSDKIQSNRNEWVRTQRISKLKAGIPTSLFASGGPDPDTMDLEFRIQTDTLVFEDYPSLTVTYWNQYLPWNDAMPLFPPDTTKHCLAGCGVIAISQLLYYTHFAFGFPNDIYENAKCESLCDEYPYKWTFENLSSSSWNYMSPYLETILDPYMPALCAYVAKRSNTRYGVDPPNSKSVLDSYGSTEISEILPTLHSFYLDNARQSDYDVTTITNEIKNRRPVLCLGGYSPTTTLGHIFIIDGYYQRKIRKSEIICDTQGNVLSEYTYIDEDFFWRINTGNDPQTRLEDRIYSSTYYPYLRTLFIGLGK